MLVGFPILALLAGGDQKFQVFEVFARMAPLYIVGIPFLVAWRKNKKKK